MGIMQNTEEWHELRKNHLGASDAPVYMGVSPFKTRYQLWMEKLGLGKPQEQTPRMQRGLELEQACRDEFYKLKGIEVKPDVKISDKEPVFIASLDGWNANYQLAVEIKCPGLKDQELAWSNIIPEKYIPQLQQQMYVYGLNSMYYCSYDGSYLKIIEINRDDDYIENMIDIGLKFWDMVLNFEPPELCDKDYIHRGDAEWMTEAKYYQQMMRKMKDLEKNIESSRQKLIQLTGNCNCQGAGLRLSQIIRRGAVNYQEIPELKDINLEKYRKPSINCWRITENKG